MKIKSSKDHFLLKKSDFKFLFNIMKICLFLLFAFTFQLMATNTKAQDAVIELKSNSVSISQLISEIEKQTDYLVVYSNREVNTSRTVTLKKKSDRVSEYLDQMFNGTDIGYDFEKNYIVLSKRSSQSEGAITSLAQTLQQLGRTVRGTVTDTNGEPVIGATIIIKNNPSQGTVTDFDGKFYLSNIQEDAVLQITYVGMKPQEVAVSGRSTIDVVMEADVELLEEIVVVGYGTQKKRDVIGSISTINSEDLIKATGSASFDAALQGLAPGLMVSNESGIPGSPVQIKVRGINSISSGTDPLWIVDGIPIVSGNMGASFDGESSQNVMSMINPADIESIQILKDAAATSIYGSRGSNGVILVTTKSGKKGAMKLSVDLKSGISNWANRDIGLATGAQYIEIMDRAYANSGMSGLYDPQASLNQLDGVSATITREEAMATNTDWGDVISRTGIFTEANLSATQGSDKGSSYLSLRYRKDNSILKFNDLEIFTANANLSYNLLDLLNINYRGNISFSNNNRSKSDHGRGGAGGWAQVNAYSLPWMKVYDNSDNGINGFWNPLSGANALAGISPLNSESNLQTTNILQGLNATLKIMEGLSLVGEFGANLVFDKGLSYRGAGIRIDGPIAQEEKNQLTVLNYNSFLNYDKNFGEDHWVNIVTGVENTRYHSHNTHLESQSLIGNFREVGRPESVKGYSVLGGESYLRGYFGRANYKYMDRYIVGTSIRRDGISKFTPENRWATFLSGSAGWIISEEEFFQSRVVNLLKLRGSYGQTGNTNIPSGITSDKYEVRTGTNLGIPSTQIVSIGNSDIKWETTSTLDFGFDFGLLNNRINGSLAYYKQNVSDMLLAVALPYSAGIFGGNVIWQNIGDMENRGIEFNVEAAVLNGPFKWNVALNFSTNSNKILALDPESDANNVGMTQIEPYEDRVITIFKKGLSLGTWYMAESAGVDPEKGIPMIYEVKVNDDGTTSHTGRIIPGTTTNMEANRMILKGKTSIPRFVGGFNHQFAYKNFDMNMNFSFATGHYIYNRLLQSTLTPNRGVRALSSRLLTEAWQKPGDVAKWPRVVMNVQHFYDDEGNPTTEPVTYGSEEKYISSMFLEKGDYLKLNNVSLGYTLPVAVAAKLKMQSLRLSLSVSNLLTLTSFSGYNPEVPLDQASAASFVSYNSMPQARTYSLGLNINF
ncbi:TonB-dependent receptor SusC [Petrimonas mucosa]|jgi:TonB-linked SusC/RagA family outer membrane protein|uniref:TonB-dependent receptor SusC n=2 Tax=Petrimonas mucosa TaxID=1642646 RepID=A0A1G4G321_9BACT|nr:TonB-dependent receptor SusC [Petrimonas mucosa]SFU40412.1 TonB-linked outer membrane protein, SusC/RagA family [Porphyromonadaceae bacterium KHP3R9]